MKRLNKHVSTRRELLLRRNELSVDRRWHFLDSTAEVPAWLRGYPREKYTYMHPNDNSTIRERCVLFPANARTFARSSVHGNIKASIARLSDSRAILGTLWKRMSLKVGSRQKVTVRQMLRHVKMERRETGEELANFGKFDRSTIEQHEWHSRVE